MTDRHTYIYVDWQADRHVNRQAVAGYSLRIQRHEGRQCYLHGSTFTGDQRKSHNVREIHGDGGEQFRLHVLPGLQVVSNCPVKQIRLCHVTLTYAQRTV